MLKAILYPLLLLVLALTAAKTEETNVIAINRDTNSASRSDDYISLNRQQYGKVLQDYDTKLTMFREYYSGRLEAVNVQLDMITASIVQMEERLNPLEVLSDFSKQCVTKYRTSIPTVTETKTSITNCALGANNQITNLLSSSLSTRNSLQNYYTNYFEKEIKNCGQKYSNTTANYTVCVTSVTTNTNSYAISNQKTFATLMESAECSAKANIKRALDCNYNIQTRTISLIAEANVLINNCLVGKDECPPCGGGFTCTESYDLEVDNKNKTILNPFYGRENNPGCLMLNVH